MRIGLPPRCNKDGYANQIGHWPSSPNRLDLIEHRVKKDRHDLSWIKPTALRFRHDLKCDILPTTYGCDMTELRRLDRLMAQRVEVAIVFREMLGAADAAEYMAANGIAQHVADRVLAGMITTRTTEGVVVGYCHHDPEATVPCDPHWTVAPEPLERAVARRLVHPAESASMVRA
jgi:hypothetical protein